MKTHFSLPELVIEVDDLPLDAQTVQSLEELRVAQKLSLPTQCELTFHNPTADSALDQHLAIGKKLRVALHEDGETLFLGEITGLEYSYGPANAPILRVRGYDLLHRLRKRQAVRAHVQENLLSLARELTSDLGLSVWTAEDNWPNWNRLIQYRQTDLELLTEQAARCGAYFTLREQELLLLTLAGTGSPTELRLGHTLFEARVNVNADPACETVKAESWDPLAAETHTGTASQPRSGRQVRAEASPSLFDESGQRNLTDELASDDHQTQALAQAELDARHARAVTFWGIAEGDALLRPGGIIELAGLAEALNGQYVLTAVTHQINLRSGFISELSTELPVSASRPRSSIVALGEVTSVSDPEAVGRVQVKLPAYNQVETEWMGVLCNAAGPHKGLIMLPNVGDRVLVLFPREDPAEGIVLGGLYGLQGPPDSGVENSSVRRYTWLTEGGQKIVLDDVRGSIHLEDKTGSTLDLAPDKVRLHSAVDLDIEAPGKSVVIRGKSIDFSRG